MRGGFTQESDSVAEKRLPFFMKEYPCPACRAASRHRQFRSRTYGPGKVESDNHVLTYVWNDPQLVQIHPPVYFLYFCPHCYFTAPSENYTEPKLNLYGRASARAFQANREGDDNVVRLLGERIDYDNLNFEVALWMHLLAIYVQLLPEDGMRDHLLIARLYLRVAWLYREEQAEKGGEKNEGAAEEAANATPKAVLSALGELDRILHQGNEGRDRIAEALKADEVRRGSENAAAYEKSLETMARLLEALHSESYRLKSTFNRSYVTALDEGDKSYNVDFLDEVKKAWVYAPADETEALRSAIEYFERAIANDARLNDPEPFFKTSALIVDLEMRCNDLDAAFKKVRGVVTGIIEDRGEILARIAKVENESHKMDLMRQLTAANRSLDRASELHELVVDKVIAREMPRVKEILAGHTGSTTGQKKVALLSGGVPHGIVHRLEERNMI